MSYGSAPRSSSSSIERRPRTAGAASPARLRRPRRRARSTASRRPCRSRSGWRRGRAAGARSSSAVIERRLVREARVSGVEDRRPAARAARLLRRVRPLVERSAALRRSRRRRSRCRGCGARAPGAARGSRCAARSYMRWSALPCVWWSQQAQVRNVATSVRRDARRARRRGGVAAIAAVSAAQLSWPCSRASACWTSRSPVPPARPACARQPRARIGIVRAQRLQPALRFLLEIVEGAHETPSFRYAWRPLMQAGRRFVLWRTGWVGDELPCRGQEAPQSALPQCERSAAPVSTLRNAAGHR